MRCKLQHYDVNHVQEICNLMLCGKATPNVFDGSRDLGDGMLLLGIDEPNAVGFLTILEAMRYCEVGSWLKQPLLPVWVLGSETHYTVLFCTDMRVNALSESESEFNRWRRAFDSLDSQGNGFIPTMQLEPLLQQLQVSVSPELLAAHTAALDAQECGIIVWDDLWTRLGHVSATQWRRGQSLVDGPCQSTRLRNRVGHGCALTAKRPLLSLALLSSQSVYRRY